MLERRCRHLLTSSTPVLPEVSTATCQKVPRATQKSQSERQEVTLKHSCHVTSVRAHSVLNARCADVGMEECVAFGLQQADWFGDCFICFSLAPACQVLPLIILICPRSAGPRPAFLHNSASSFCIFIMIKRRKMILWPQERIRGWYLCPILGYAVGQII